VDSAQGGSLPSVVGSTAAASARGGDGGSPELVWRQRVVKGLLTNLY
jgi:hypothetical protein